jgi:hypothetical protein
MLKTLGNRFVLKYVGLYKIIRKPRPNVYTLQLPTTLVAHLTFHVSKLKLVHEEKKKKDWKQAYHLGFDLIEHKLLGEMECILATRQTR